MIRELFYKLYSACRSLTGDGSMIVLYFASAIAVYMMRPERKAKVWPALLFPVGAIGLAVSGALEKVYVRFKENRAARYAATAFTACLAALAIASSGKMVFSGEFSERADNEMHLPNYLESAMSEILIADPDPVVLVPDKWSAYFGAFSSRFDTDPDSLSAEERQIIQTELAQNRPDMKKISAIAHRRGCKYVVLPSDMWPDVPITKCGYEVMSDCGGCIVYREVSDP